MTETVVTPSTKACAVNPIKLSPALGGAFAFLGVDRSLPLFHGSQGCTAFALVLLVRHFREAIPLQTTAMSELTTILGGTDNVEQAINNIYQRAKPSLIGICSTALTETRGEDVQGDLGPMFERHPEWNDLEVVFAATPDYGGSLEEGWSRAVTALIKTLVPNDRATRTLRQVNVLAGSHLTPADVEHVRELVEAFGLSAIVLPDISQSLDGHVPDEHVATSMGGTTIEEIRLMGRSVETLAIGEHMRPAAEALEKRAGVPFRVFPRLTGLDANDAFIAALMEISGAEPPVHIRRDRSRLVDAMLDGHFYFEDRKIAIAGEADLVLAFGALLAGMGAEIAVAIAPSSSPALSLVPGKSVAVGDLEDLQRAAVGCDLVIGSSHAETVADAVGAPLFRAGFPVVDRIGGWHQLQVGYRGTRQLVFEIANMLIGHSAAQHKHHSPGNNAHDPVAGGIAHVQSLAESPHVEA